ncbi:hypothetical protein VTI28DRAFT_4913 [Corynascus sepedonium]
MPKPLIFFRGKLYYISNVGSRSPCLPSILFGTHHDSSPIHLEQENGEYPIRVHRHIVSFLERPFPAMQQYRRDSKYIVKSQTCFRFRNRQGSEDTSFDYYTVPTPSSPN